MHNPRISIVLPVYNAEMTLRRCVESVAAQTYTSFELIIIDDGSTDTSHKICKDLLKKDRRIKYFYKNNGGVSSARNMGISKASGEWITFIDADDWVTKDWLQLYINRDSHEIGLKI